MSLADNLHDMISRGLISYGELREELVSQAFLKSRQHRDVTEDEEALREAINLWIGDDALDAPVTVGKYLDLWNMLNDHTRTMSARVEAAFAEARDFIGCTTDDEKLKKLFEISRKERQDGSQSV